MKKESPELKFVNNKGRCSRCCHSEKKDIDESKYPLIEDEYFRIRVWQYCHKYGRYCKGIASRCKAPQDGYRE